MMFTSSRIEKDVLWVCPSQVFDGHTLHNDKALVFKGGSFAELVFLNEVPPEANRRDLEGIVSPGFFDIQVNGGGGVLFNADQSQEGLVKLALGHRKFGTTACLPTVITDAPEVLDAACDAIIEASGKNGIQGIHIEGPHISLARKGTHDPQWVRPLDDRTKQQVARLLAAHVPVLITVAPEGVAPGDIAELVQMGAVVSIGHTGATGAEVAAALAEGAQLFTHLFNGMSQMQNRDPGAVGTGINSEVYCSVIADGHHVADEMLSLAIRARPVEDHMILVSDAMSTVGGPDSFSLYGQEIHLSDGKLINQEGSLAGAHVTMMEAVERVVHVLKRPLQEALRMAITNPAKLMGLTKELATLSPDNGSSLVHISPDLKNCQPVDPAKL